MTNRGDLMRVARKLNTVLNRNEQQNRTSSSPGKPNFSGNFIQALCFEEHLYAMDCVKIVMNDTYDMMPLAKYPESGDDAEVTMFGSVLMDSHDGRSVFVAIGGKVTFKYLNTTLSSETKLYTNIGERIYPLKEVDGFGKGYVSSQKCGAAYLIESVLGRALDSEKRPVDGVSDDSRTQLVNCYLTDPGKGAGISYADRAMKPNERLIDPTDPPSPTGDHIPRGYYADGDETERIYADGVAVLEDMIILTTNQPAEEQKMWQVKENEDWVDLGSPDQVFIRLGEYFQFTLWTKFTPDPTILVPEPVPYYVGTRAFQF